MIPAISSFNQNRTNYTFEAKSKVGSFLLDCVDTCTGPGAIIHGVRTHLAERAGDHAEVTRLNTKAKQDFEFFKLKVRVTAKVLGNIDLG